MRKMVMVPGLTYEDGEADALDGQNPQAAGRAYLFGYLEAQESEIEALLRQWVLARDRLKRLRKASATRAGVRLSSLMDGVV